MADPITVTLSKPIQHDGQIYETLTFREATAGDFADAEAVEGEFNKTLSILAGMAETPLAVLRKVPMREMGKIGEDVAILMGESAPSAASSTQ